MPDFLKVLLSEKSVCVRVYVLAPEAITFIHVILYNQLNKFVAFRNFICMSVTFATKHVVTETKVIKLC